MSYVLIVESPYYKSISDELLLGAKKELEEKKVQYKHVIVSGALEIPQAIAFAINSKNRNGHQAIIKFDGVIALGCVIRGETSHYEIVSVESARSIMSLAINNNIPIGNAILTVDSMEQAKVRAHHKGRNKGGDAAQACLNLINLKAIL